MKILIRILCFLAIITTVSSISYSVYTYTLFKKASEDADKLSSYVESQSKSFTLKGIGIFEEREITTNSALDTINQILRPHVTISGVVYGEYNPDEFHKSDNKYFSIEELSILSHHGWLDSIIPNNNSRKLKNVDTLYYNAQLTFPDSLREQSLSRAILSTLVLATWIILLYFSVKATKSEFYKDDYLFIRYAWANNSSIIGRRLISILLNILLFAAFFATIIMPITIDSYEYEYSSSDFNTALAVFAGCIIIILSTWILTSLGWWVFGKKTNN